MMTHGRGTVSVLVSLFAFLFRSDSRLLCCTNVAGGTGGMSRRSNSTIYTRHTENLRPDTANREMSKDLDQSLTDGDAGLMTSFISK